MTHQEKTILDTQIKGITFKLVWGFVCSIVAGTFVACACYFGLLNKINLMQRDITDLQKQVSALNQQQITKN